MSDLGSLFEKLKNNEIHKNDLDKLLAIIKEFIYYQPYLPNKDDLEDIINDILLSLLTVLKNSENEIQNPDAYLRAIVVSKIQSYSQNQNEIQQLIRHTKNILEDLKKKGKIYSYQSRTFCIDEVPKINNSKEEIIKFGLQYDFTEINHETRWTQKKKDLISEFILEFLDYVGCVEFSTLIDILKIKLGLKMIKYTPEPQNFDNDDDFDNSFENDISKYIDEEDIHLIKEIGDSYEKSLRTFLQKDSEKNKMIISILYLYFYEKKSLQEIAQLLSYKSPTSIQVFIKDNYALSPDGFLVVQNLIDEKISNHFSFFTKLQDELLYRLEVVYISMMNDV
ncbi:MAG: hypothetical protein ACK4G1_01690 [Ignavibacteria bacterium]